MQISVQLLLQIFTSVQSQETPSSIAVSDSCAKMIDGAFCGE